jgi:hypothetical protein
MDYTPAAFIEELKDYREPVYGLLGDGIKPTTPSGNALLYEAHAGFIYDDLNGVGPAHFVAFYKAADLLAVNSGQLAVDIGLLNKKPPPAADFQTHDDYIGCAAYSRSCALKIVEHGKAHGWVFDNRTPSLTFWQALKTGRLEAWHGRFPGLVAHYLIASGEDPGFLHWLMWLGTIFNVTRSQGDESAWLLTYLKVRAAERMFPDHWH